MQILLVVLAIWLALVVLGFLVHLLWILALILGAGWLFGYAFRRGQNSR